MADYPKEQLQELYENIPEELQGAMSSEKTGDSIHSACTRNGINKSDKINEVAKYTGYVLLGLLSPDDFQKKLEKEVKIKKDIAKQIALEINRFVFFPVKDSLEGLYKTEIKADLKSQKTTTPSKTPVQPPKGKDRYREPTA